LNRGWRSFFRSAWNKRSESPLSIVEHVYSDRIG
jgi:hypothetical protein